MGEAYLCEAEAGGGIVYDKDKRYRGTEFNVSNEKAIFKKDDKGFWIAHEFPESDYSIKYSCNENKNVNEEMIGLVCKRPNTYDYWGEYELYIPKLRYVFVRSVGWEGFSPEELGIGMPQLTPHIIVGKCSKI